MGVQAAAPAAGATAGHGIGLTNVRERLRVLYGDTAEMEIRSRPGEGTLVRFVLPRVDTSSASASAATDTGA